MRKIEQAMVAAILARRNWSGGNTAVRCCERQDGKPLLEVALHGNHIATVGYSIATGLPCSLSVSLADWNTQTTRGRLSAIIRALSELGPHGLGVSTKEGQPRLHDAKSIREIDAAGWHTVELLKA